MTPDMHEYLLGQHQRHIDQMAKQDDDEDRAAKAAHAARKAEVMQTFADGGHAAAELLADHDCSRRDDSPTAHDVLADLMRLMAEGGTCDLLVRLRDHMEAVAEAEAQAAGSAAMCDVARRAL